MRRLIMSPSPVPHQDAHTRISGTCVDATHYGKSDSADVIMGKELEIGRVSWLSRWTQPNHRSLKIGELSSAEVREMLQRKRQERSEGREGSTCHWWFKDGGRTSQGMWAASKSWEWTSADSQWGNKLSLTTEGNRILPATWGSKETDHLLAPPERKAALLTTWFQPFGSLNRDTVKSARLLFHRNCEIRNLGYGLPWWCSGWGSACQCRGHGFGPWSGGIPHAAERLGPWATIAEPAHLQPVLRNRKACDGERPAHHDEEWPPLATIRESPRTETRTQHSHK